MTLEEKAKKVLELVKREQVNSNYAYIKNIVLPSNGGNFDSFYCQQDRGGSSTINFSFFPTFKSDSLQSKDFPVYMVGTDKNGYNRVKMIVAFQNSGNSFLTPMIFAKNENSFFLQGRYGAFYNDGSSEYYQNRDLQPNMEEATNTTLVTTWNIWQHGGISPELDSLTIDFRNGYENISVLGCYFVVQTFATDGSDGLTIDEIKEVLNYDSVEDLKNRNNVLFVKFRKYCFNYTDESEDDFRDKLGTEYTMLNITHKTDALQKNDAIINQVNFKMVVPQGKKISGYVSNDVPYNIVLQTDAETIYYYPNRYSETYETIYELPQINMTFPDFITDGQGNFYYAIMSTNIPIFNSKQDSDMYQNGQKDKEDSLNGGGAYSPPKNKTGEDIDEMDVDSYDDGVYISNSGGFSTTHVLTHSQVQSVFTNLYDENVVGWDALIKGLELYGTRPIESIIDLYYIPFNINEFCESSLSDGVFFGKTKVPVSSHRIVGASGKMKTLVNTIIAPTFGDFRDFSNVQYMLYLPFYGIMQIKPEIVVGKLLKVKCTFDVKAHVLKYWLFADNMLFDMVECEIAVKMPIIASDFASKAQRITNATTSLYSAGKGLANNVINSPSAVSASVNTLDYALSNASSIMSNVSELTSNAPMSICGNSTSNTACYDIKYPFLIIDIQETVIPQMLTSEYGRPTNAITKIGYLGGYCEIDDLQLESYATESEKEKIKELCRQGIRI